jgi:RNA-binding protein 25
MEEMRSLAEEQRKAGLLLDDGAPVKLNVSLAPAPSAKVPAGTEGAASVPVFGQEEEEEGTRKRKASLIKLDFSANEGGEKARQRLEKIKESVPTDREILWKVKVRWDAVNEVCYWQYSVFLKTLLTVDSNWWTASLSLSLNAR